jgi:hypothetical protein
MKRLLLAVFALLSTAALAQQPAPPTAPLIPYDSVPNFLKLPTDLNMGEAAGVAVNSLYVSDSFPGRIYKLSLDGKVLGMLGRSGKQLKQFGWIHAIACPNENMLYVAELLNWRVQKLILHPEQQRASSH